MRKYGFCLMVFLAAVIILPGCGPGDIQSRIDEEFTLSIGQTIVIGGENLKIRFKAVTEDSRCPRDVTCIWAGRATFLVELEQSGISQSMTLTQPGLSDEYSKTTYEKWGLTFLLTPYPQAGEKISKDAYRLQTTVSKLPALTGILGSIITDPLSYEGQIVAVVGYYRGWDLLHELNTSPPITRSDWVITDSTGSIYVSATSKIELPRELIPSSLEVVNTIIEIEGEVDIAKGGQPYLDATSFRQLF